MSKRANETQERYTYVDLLMDNGELVRIECPEKHSDDLFETLDNTMKRGDWWSPRQFDGCYATYMGRSMDRVSMKRVVGVL